MTVRWEAREQGSKKAKQRGRNGDGSGGNNLREMELYVVYSIPVSGPGALNFLSSSGSRYAAPIHSQVLRCLESADLFRTLRFRKRVTLCDKTG